MSKYDFTPAEHDLFFDAYRTCALWSSTDDEGEPIDDLYSDDDIAIDTHNQMLRDCNNFLDTYGILVRRAMRVYGYTIQQAGHDFWLTRNHHGVGFWDRGLQCIGDWLTRMAHLEGSADLYIHNGSIYQSGF